MESVKQRIRFVIVVIIAHTIAYLFSGGIAYQFITKPLWEGSDSLLASYLRTPGNEELWGFAMIWQIPGQVLRSLLMGLVFLPLFSSLKTWTFFKKFLFMSSLLFVLTHLAAAAPSPANIEGLVYMRPEFVALGFIKMQPEMILYSIIAGILFSKFAYKKDSLSINGMNN
ncbi:MAG: hypothetical protein IPG07_10970 [Crocinitomicaceae bacterium]|nr:hypothetical protein [Crocinitomicaceae bacterium]